jgi:hypothetical protein
VTPAGDLVLRTRRSAHWIGNRGCLHRGDDVVREWNGRRWITCTMAFRGWRAPYFEPGRWTLLFFDDEAVALAAGHRPCALCRRADYRRYQAAWGGRPSADQLDLVLHRDRLDGRTKRVHECAWRELPAGAFVVIDDCAHLVQSDRLVPWTASGGYGESRSRPTKGNATVLTPAANVAVLRAGYVPHVHAGSEQSTS